MSKKLVIKTPITNETEDYLLNLPDKESGNFTIAATSDVPARWYKHQTSFSFYYKHIDDPTTTINNGTVSVTFLSTYKGGFVRSNKHLLRFGVCQALNKGLSYSTSSFLDSSAIFITTERFYFWENDKKLRSMGSKGCLPVFRDSLDYRDEFHPYYTVEFDTGSGDGTIYIQIFEPDKIDVTTGEVIKGRNIIADTNNKAQITWSTSDTVTEIGE